MGALFTYAVQLKTPDTLNLGYAPGGQPAAQNRWWAKICVNIELMVAVNDISAGWSRRRGWWGHEGRSVTYEPVYGAVAETADPHQRPQSIPE